MCAFRHFNVVLTSRAGIPPDLERVALFYMMGAQRPACCHTIWAMSIQRPWLLLCEITRGFEVVQRKSYIIQHALLVHAAGIVWQVAQVPSISRA